MYSGLDGIAGKLLCPVTLVSLRGALYMYVNINRHFILLVG